MHKGICLYSKFPSKSQSIFLHYSNMAGVGGGGGKSGHRILQVYKEFYPNEWTGNYTRRLSSLNLS